MSRPVRVAVRAIILRDNKLCLVNAWPGGKGDILCCPGGGVEPKSSLPENLAREVWEETGMRIEVGHPCLVNEFHDPDSDYHQVEVFFHATAENDPPDGWADPEGIVSDIRWVSRDEIGSLRARPASLAAIVWHGASMIYDPLEPILR